MNSFFRYEEIISSSILRFNSFLSKKEKNNRETTEKKRKQIAGYEEKNMEKYKNIRFAIMDYFQGTAIEMELDVKDLLILKWFSDYAMTGKMIHKKEEDVIYYQVKYQSIIDQLPILKLNTRKSIYRRMKAMEQKQILLSLVDSSAEGTYAYYAMGPKYIDLLYTDPNKNVDDFMEVIKRLNEKEKEKVLSALSAETQSKLTHMVVDNQGVNSNVQGVKTLKCPGGGGTQMSTHNISNTSNVSNKHNKLNTKEVNNYNNVVKKSKEQKQLEFNYLSLLYTDIKTKSMSQKEETRLRKLIRTSYAPLIEIAMERSRHLQFPMANTEKLIQTWTEKGFKTPTEILYHDEIQRRERMEEHKKIFRSSEGNQVDPNFYYNWMDEE